MARRNNNKELTDITCKQYEFFSYLFSKCYKRGNGCYTYKICDGFYALRYSDTVSMKTCSFNVRGHTQMAAPCMEMCHPGKEH
jgi:hypothetical protein